MRKQGEYVIIEPEDDKDLNLLLFGLAALSDDMIKAGDPFGVRLDNMLLRFFGKLREEDAEGRQQR